MDTQNDVKKAVPIYSSRRNQTAVREYAENYRTQRLFPLRAVNTKLHLTPIYQGADIQLRVDNKKSHWGSHKPPVLSRSAAITAPVWVPSKMQGD